MLKAGFIGAGGRSRTAHYPCVKRLPEVEMSAVCELDEDRLGQIVREYDFDHVFTDHRRMLDEVELDVVYCVMREHMLLAPALDCINAGKHVFIEKPPGANSAETQRMLDAAIAGDVYVMVGFQRRYAAVTREAMRLVASKGPVSLATATFNKRMLGGDGKEFTTTLWNDVSHVVDLLRYMAGGEPVEVHAYRDRFGGESRNHYTALVRFDNGSTGAVFGNRASGGRVLRSELHGVGIGCYMKIPEEIEIYEDDESRIVGGWEVDGVDMDEVRRYEGTLTMHEHFVDCVLNRKTPISDLRDVIHSMHLVDRIEGNRQDP